MSHDSACLLGFDIGSTTCRALVAVARIARNCVTGRREFHSPEVIYRSEPVWTPFVENELDAPRLEATLDGWIAESRIDPSQLLSGGVIVTGLAARTRNVGTVASLIRKRLGEAPLVTADDPGLESWIAFLGNCADLSRAEPDAPFLNLDIGGGTTNLALGRAGEVQRVGCYDIGARHVRFEPGTWRIAGLSPPGRLLLAALEIDRSVGDVMSHEERNAVLNYNANFLESLVEGDTTFHSEETARALTQVPLGEPPDASSIVTFSGGVGELMYLRARGEPLPEPTAFGDLGVELACRLCGSPRLSRHLTSHVPANLGRATVYGLTLHHAELSGATLYLPRPDVLPLSELPVLGCIDPMTSEERLNSLLDLAATAHRGGCVQVVELPDDWQQVKQFGGRLARTLRERSFPRDCPLVLLVEQNFGRTLGQYATEWGKLPVTLFAIDEVPVRRARFVSLGRARDNLVPVSFYGMHESETR